MRIQPALALVLALAAAPVAAQDRGALFNDAWTAWHAPDYPAAYRLLSEVRALPYGRQAVVDFMLGTSACRIAGVVDYGARLLDWMQYAYALTLESRRVVQVERDLCIGAVAAATARPGEIEEIVELRSAGMTGYGKTFYWANEQNQPVTSYPIRRNRDMPRSELTARLVPLDDPEPALAIAGQLAPGVPAVAERGFLIIGHNGQSEAGLTGVADMLADYRDFLVRAYGMLPPQHFIRIELARDPWAVQMLAGERHGLDVSRATLGYAFVDDASIIAAVPDVAAGTVLHELFHLLVRSNFGDVPQWLDEGVASIYEVSARVGDRFEGRENWRREVLEETWGMRPDVDALIRTEWFSFDDPEQAGVEPDAIDLEDPSAEARRAATMAMARYFAMYLDARGKLGEVFAAVREQGLDDLDGDPGAHVVELVEQVTGQDAVALDDGFVAWFRTGRLPEPTASAEGDARFVTTANLNVRSGPGTGFERLATLPEGTVLAATGLWEGWIELVLSDGAVGFASTDFLRPIEGGEATLQKWQPSK